MTMGIGADAVLECVGTQESMIQGIRSTRPGGSMAHVGVPHGVELDGEQLSFAHVHLHGGPAPVRRYLPELIHLVWRRKINPGKVLDAAAAVRRATHVPEACVGTRRAANANARAERRPARAAGMRNGW